MIAAAARGDLIEKAGLKMPETFDELEKVLAAVHDQEGCKAFVADNLHHWNWPPFLMGFGGKVFKDPPDNMTPTLDSAESIKAADYYCRLLSKYTPEGVLSYTDDQCISAQQNSRANYRSSVIAFLAPIGDPEKSKTAKTVKYSLVPGGPAGRFPGSNSNNFGIPLGAKNKDAAWEFIKWALSKEMVMRYVTEKGYAAPCRLSVINSPEFKKKMTLNGQDVADLYVQVMQLAGKSGYMKYRITPVFSQAGAAINKAISAVASGQMPAEPAMKQAQSETVADLKKAGVKMDL
ncbi:MAG: extracellular solute-binding protein [Dehalococcoidales bacterium]|nr:extracellular solute-binding protein [Dehalococcoidales bacterium]